MNIAVFDLQHFEMVHVWHHVFDDPKNNIHFFVNQNIADKIRKSGLSTVKYTAVIEQDYPDIDAFFNACLDHIDKHSIDAIIFNTIDVHYKNTWKFIKRLDIAIFITVHNINTWLNPPFTLNKRALGFYYYRRKMLSKTTAVILQEELFIDYVKNKTSFKKPVFAGPYTLNEKQIPLPSNSKLVVAIPGAIDGHRRDNDFSLSAIEKINARSKNVRFVFIGGISGHLGEKIYARIQELKKQGLDVEHYFEKDSNVIFDREMSACDIVFLPLIVNTKYEGIPEVYGVTKATGVLYDLMRFQKPCIAPTELIIPPTMRSSVISYKNENDFVELILKLANDRSQVTELINNAKANSVYYTKDKIKERVLGKIESLVSKHSATSLRK